MKKTFLKPLALGLCAAVCVTSVGATVYARGAMQKKQEPLSAPAQTTSASAAEETEAPQKDETVYVLAGADGSVQKIIVSDWIKNTLGSSTLTDSSELENVENVKGDEGYTMDASNARVWDAAGNDIYYQGNIEKELPGSADLVLQKVVPRSFHAEAAWLGGSGNGLRWGVALKARYDYRRGDEGIVDDNNSSQGSGTLGFLTLFEYSALQGRAEAVFGVEAAGHAWYVCPWGEYRRRTSDYLYPAQNMEFTRAGGGVDFRCVLQRRSLLLRLEAGGGYTAGLDSGLTLPVADLAAPLVRMVQYDYDRLRQDAATFRLGLRADYALRRRMSLFLAADYGGGLYGDNTAAHHARVACGIAF